MTDPHDHAEELAAGIIIRYAGTRAALSFCLLATAITLKIAATVLAVIGLFQLDGIWLAAAAATFTANILGRIARIRHNRRSETLHDARDIITSTAIGLPITVLSAVGLSTMVPLWAAIASAALLLTVEVACLLAAARFTRQAREVVDFIEDTSAKNTPEV